MAYEKQTWQNNPPSTATPITAARLSHLETQYDEAMSDMAGAHSQNVSGSTSLPVMANHLYELTATSAATVTLTGAEGTQVAIRWSGTSGTVEGQAVTAGQTWVAVRWVSGWVLYEVGGSGGGGDTTPPIPGTLAASAVAATSFTLTVSGASDAGSGLHAQPFRFSTDNGSTWSSWQASPSLIVSGKTAATTYQCQHQVRDAAGNVASGVVVPVTTTAASVPMVATFRDSHVDPAGAASYTWTGAALGAASGSRRVIVGLIWRGTTPQAALPGVTVGGVTASRIGSNGTSAASGQMFFSAAVPTGTTGDVVVTFDAAVFRIGMAVWTAGKTPTFVQEHKVDAVASTSTTLTTAATAEQAVLGMSVLLGDPQTASPAAYDAQDDIGAPGPGGYKFMAWHRNGASLSQTVESSGAAGSALQVTLS